MTELLKAERDMLYALVKKQKFGYKLIKKEFKERIEEINQFVAKREDVSAEYRFKQR